VDDNKREQIRKAALAVFSRRGFHETTVAEIAEEAGIAKGTIYLYFKNKNDLLLDLVRRNHEEIEAEVALILEQERTPGEQIRAVVRQMLKYRREKFEVHRVLFTQYLRADDAQDPVIREMKQAMEKRVQMVMDIYREGVRQKEFRDLDPLFAVEMLSGMFHQFLLRDLSKPGGCPPEEQGDQILDLFFHGVLMPSEKTKSNSTARSHAKR